MSSQSNFPTISENLNYHSATITNGGQKSNGGGWVSVTYVDHEVPLTGEWYWEYITDNYVYAFMGIGKLQYQGPHHHNTDFAFVQGGEYRYNGTNQANTSNIGTGDIIGVYVNNGIIKVYVNNSLDHTYTQNLSIVGEPVFPAVFGSSNTTINFGQDSSFLGVKTAQGNSDGNGIGDFYYTPPGNALALCSANSPTSSDIDPSQTDDDYPGKQFNAITYTGNASTQAISGLGFQPDMVWFQRRDYTGSYNQGIIDSSRGASLGLYPDVNNAEADFGTSDFTSFDSDGFTLKAGGSANINNNGSAFVAWCWRCNGGTTVSDSSGSITCTRQTNVSAGFSIVTYTGGNGSWGSTNTYGHGLSQAPEFIITKERNVVDEWSTFHAHVGNGGGSNAAANSLNISTNASLYTNQSYKAYAGVMPTSSLVTVEGNTTNSTSSNHVAYIWHSVPGYSKFGKYIANQDANGTYVHLGFRPKLLVIRNIGNAGDGWRVYDSAREPSNVMNLSLSWHNSNAESTGTSNNIDFMSSGFKLKAANPTVNWGSPYGPYVYMAWADISYKFNNIF